MHDYADFKYINQGMFVFSQNDPVHQIEPNRPFRSDAFAIILVQKGELLVQCNLNTYNLQANDILFALPDSLYEIPYLSSDLSFLCLVFQKKFLEKQGVTLSSSDAIRIFSEGTQLHYVLSEQEAIDFSVAIYTVHKKTQLDKNAPFYHESVRHSFLSVIYDAALMFHKHSSIAQVRLNRKEELASSFLNLLAESFKKERSVQYYADVLSITPRHLSVVVKEVTGKTAGELIDDVVIKEAKALLSQPSMNVAQTAQILEFSNQSFFGKFFKHHTGVSPSEYRSNSRNFQNPPF